MDTPGEEPSFNAIRVCPARNYPSNCARHLATMKEMKVLVFAHTPPPFHGQSFMVQQLLENVGGKDVAGGDLVLYHVNAQLSRDVEDVGSWRLLKLLLLVGYILQAWAVWLRHRPETLYYVPAPAKSSAIIRDWLVLALVAPLFRHQAYHWHGAGLGRWVAEGLKTNRLAARVTRRLYLHHDLSIVMNEYARQEAVVFEPAKIEVVANGISDPCPAFETEVLPERIQRWKRRREESSEAHPPFKLLFLGQATASKGLFDAVDAVARVNARFKAAQVPHRLCLTVAGSFVEPAEEAAFRKRIAGDDLALTGGTGKTDRAVIYAGYVDASFKALLLRESDALCFPSFFPNEVQPVSIVEALAFGMPVLSSRWHGLPSMIPSEIAHLVEPRDVAGLAEALPRLLEENRFGEYRRCYQERYTMAEHCRRMREALLSIARKSACA